MRLRTRLCRLERSCQTPGVCPGCGVQLTAVRYVLAVEPPEPHAPVMPPRLEPEWGTLGPNMTERGRVT
jgi:hypothetical protein